VYQTALKHVLETRGTLAETEVKLPIMFEGVQLESGLRIDLLVEKCVIAELKSVEKMNPVYEAQLITYLRLSNIRLGFLINFNVPHLKEGIKRIVV
ncbi:MAG: GxxExxY protein, partial [Anaerolineales bacterium]